MRLAWTTMRLYCDSTSFLKKPLRLVLVRAASQSYARVTKDELWDMRTSWSRGWWGQEPEG
eukprot:4604272-Pleurochrysis_carterae.AAC.5